MPDTAPPVAIVVKVLEDGVGEILPSEGSGSEPTNPADQSEPSSSEGTSKEIIAADTSEMDLAALKKHFWGKKSKPKTYKSGGPTCCALDCTNNYYKVSPKICCSFVNGQN